MRGKKVEIDSISGPPMMAGVGEYSQVAMLDMWVNNVGHHLLKGTST